MWLWVIAGFAALASAGALWSVRRLRRQVADLGQSYWELRYEYTRLRSRVARLDPDARAEPEAAAQETPPAPLRQAQDRPASFVPLSSLKSGAPRS